MVLFSEPMDFLRIETRFSDTTELPAGSPNRYWTARTSTVQITWINYKLADGNLDFLNVKDVI